MTIVRDIDAKRLNVVLNHPEVLPKVTEHGETSLDLTPVILDPRNYLLMEESGMGGLLFIAKGPGLYEVHTQFVPESGPKLAMRTVHECLEWMFTRTDMMELWSKVPVSNTPARHLAELAGGTRQFTRHNGWAEQIDLDYYRVTYGDWVNGSTRCRQAGETFHAKLDSALGAESHEEDSTHNRWVGGTLLAIQGGQVDKAVVFYNRWAVIADYQPIRLVAIDPVILDIKTALLVASGDSFEVVRR